MANGFLELLPLWGRSEFWFNIHYDVSPCLGFLVAYEIVWIDCYVVLGFSLLVAAVFEI